MSNPCFYIIVQHLLYICSWNFLLKIFFKKVFMFIFNHLNEWISVECGKLHFIRIILGQQLKWLRKNNIAQLYNSIYLFLKNIHLSQYLYSFLFNHMCSVDWSYIRSKYAYISANGYMQYNHSCNARGRNKKKPVRYQWHQKVEKPRGSNLWLHLKSCSSKQNL